MRVTVFGLGEAGSSIAADLVAAGADVHAYDPGDVATPSGVARHGSPRNALKETELVLSLTAASHSKDALTQAADAIQKGGIYADLAAASPSLKEDLAAMAASMGVLFADVALMAPVPGRGLATPALASGSGAQGVADLINPLGGRIEVIGDQPGQASARKLLRSVMTKGLAALLSESMEAARVAGDAEWVWEHLVELLTSVEEGFLERLLHGPKRHAARRLDEMEAAEEFLRSLGCEPIMTRATVDHLRLLLEKG